MRRTLGFGVQCGVYDLFHFFGTDPWWPTPSFFHSSQAGRSAFGETLSPQDDGGSADVEPRRDLVVRYTFGCH